ncbi:NAD(P)/FAD-dependent oxidoreductase [Streptomyces sp. RS10V-4]|uniref:NAD(P)/FAD-dependent oxidoreductase n=1 Tax=Streptomyces rhizoryzae TaxID=2932493 RepID=UPI0020056286|nr:FAD/NAD(P)-binding oxidoreductase [Streptomyces rhizoryzae]MCK7624913.1 NAD(P)/FAD-dependent oxidoreductase [Streptomyces rhizoryzae]
MSQSADRPAPAPAPSTDPAPVSATAPEPAPPHRPHHQVLIVGGGTAGITVAARLRRAGLRDVALLEPAETHWYQPLWTLVGGGQAPLRAALRPEAEVIPPGVRWLRERATAVDPVARTVTTAAGRVVSYEWLVLAPGLSLDWDGVPGLAAAVGHDGVSSNYRADLAPYTWELIRRMRRGTAVFSMPSGPVKCGGAPQKIAYLAADHWRKRGVLGDIRVILALPEPSLFKVPVFARALEGAARRYGIEVRLRTELTGLDGPERAAALTDHATGRTETVRYDLLHAVPPQRAPQWVADGPLADPASPYGYVSADPHTLRHPDFPTVFALGDVANLPTSKTGAAIRKQAPVVVANLLAGLRGRPAAARYDGYTSCPLVTARHKMVLAEFDYDLRPAPSFPFLDTTRERTDMWFLKRYGLPQLYFQGMLKGRA